MKRNRIPVQVAGYPELSQVMTTQALADYIGVHRTTVLRAIDDGRLAAVFSGNVWLVSVRSAEKLFWRPGTRRNLLRRRSGLRRKWPVGLGKRSSINEPD